MLCSLSHFHSLSLLLYIYFYAPCAGYQSKDDEKRARAEAKRAKDYEFAEMLPYVMEFIELRFVAHSALVSKHFNYGCSQYKYYTDVRDSVPWNVSEGMREGVRE